MVIIELLSQKLKRFSNIMPINKIILFLSKLQNRHYLMHDVIVLVLSPLIALFLRLEGKLDLIVNWSEVFVITFVLLVFKLIIFRFFGLYNRLWKNASVDELARIIFSAIFVLLVEIFVFVLMKFLGNKIAGQFAYSLPLLDTIITISFVSISRFSSRLFEAIGYRIENKEQTSNLLIIGAGQTGLIVLTELLRSPSFGRIVGFLDDDVNKLKLKLKGIPILGTINELNKIVSKKSIKKIVIAMPTAPGTKIKEIYHVCKKLDVDVLTVPSLQNIINGKVSVNSIRKIKLEDLLRREQVETNTDDVKALIKNNIVLISGAGGSIGSELVRQVLSFNPMKLVLLGHGENSVFEIEQEILTKDGICNTEIISMIADVRNKKRLEKIFKEFKPKLVFHAAAHKHVPLMEGNVEEAVTNNLLGTKNLVATSVTYDVEKFVLISSDKAVNPTNIMGASKRMAEMVVLSAAVKYKKAFSAVRFGNVLGSRGSVVGIFKKQIEVGGPIKITHPEIKRYFMTIPEAVQLVLQTSSLNKGGEIFVLDMGEPVKIIDLAKDMIKFSGLKFGEDIDIEITGLRPGEKLFEELFLETEQYSRTKHIKIYLAMNAAKGVHPNFEKLSQKLIDIAIINNSKKSEMVKLIKEIVPEFNHAENKI